MKSLKLALSVQNHLAVDRSIENLNSSLLKGVNKSNSHTVWTLDVDDNDEITEQSLQTDKLLRILNEKLESAHKKNKHLTENTFERIIEEFQDEAGGTKSQLAYLMVIQDKLGDLLQFVREELKPYISMFNDMLVAKMIKIRAKEKKVGLNNFQNIANSNFKKKRQEKPDLKKHNQVNQVNRSKEKRKASDSIEKLSRLISVQKKPSKQSQAKDDNRNNLSMNVFNQSISFSTALATTVTVKSRRKKQHQQIKQKPKNNDKTEDCKSKDEAFIFYRPKKHKK